MFLNRIILFVALVCLASTLTQAQSTKSASAASYLERGNQWLKQGEMERAIEDFNLAIAFDASSPVAFFNRGIARYLKGDLDGALSDYNKALLINPKYGEALLNRGTVYADQQ